MKVLRRMITGSLLATVLALAMTAAAAPAPVQAASTVLYVDDSPANNGPNACPITPHENLQDALTALGSTKTNVTIYVCFGGYSSLNNTVAFNGFTNLKVVGKGGPMFFDAGLLAGPFITVANSTKVTLSGLTINGYGMLVDQAMGILFANSSGTIKNNVIVGWHQSYSAPPTSVAAGIAVTTTDVAHKVVVDRNTVLDAQDMGIYTTGPGKTQITRNRITFHSDLDVPPTYPPAPAVQTGIALFMAGPGVKVSGNIIDSNSGEEPLCSTSCPPNDDVSRGILVMQSSGAVIKGNTVSFLKWGISVESWCFNSGSDDTHADGNTISGNKLNNNGAGVRLLAENYYGTACVAHADGNKVTGNKFNRYFSGATLGVHLKAALPATAAGNIVKSNKFYGYYALTMAIAPDGDGVTGLVDSPNTLITMPLTGTAQ